MRIKVKLHDGAAPLKAVRSGSWIDLMANADYEYQGPVVRDGAVRFRTLKIPLGISMALPAGYEAVVVPRSSTWHTYGLIQSNSMGVIDSRLCSIGDQWMFSCIALKPGIVNRYDRLCRFRIQLSQKATVWQKIRWLLTGGSIEFEYVDRLSGTGRQGFGKETGARQWNYRYTTSLRTARQ